MASTRINGIMSGFDTEALVKAQVSYQQAQIDRLNQNTQLLTWQRERYTEVYKKIEEFRTKMFDYRLSGKTLVKTAASSSESAVSASVNADAVVGTHNLKIHSLAKGAQTGSAQAMGSSSNKTSLETQFVDGSNTAVYQNDFALTINGKTINVDTSKSMNELVKQINASGAGVSASYDANTDRFFIASSSTGAQAKIDFTGTTGDGLAFLQNTLKMPSSNGTDLDILQGEDAVFDLDGITGLTQSSNEFTIAGISYNLKEADPTKTHTITVKNNTDATVTAVKEFVDMYNSMLDLINSTVYEKKQSSFKPLTDEQKKAMTADQIKDWETNAKKGILRSDSILSRTASDMRTTIYTEVKGVSGTYNWNGANRKFNSLFGIGIETGDYSTNGKLSLDEEKLKAALEADPEAVNKLFTGGTDYQGNKTDGVAQKLYDQLKESMDKIDAKAGSSRGDKDLVSNISKKITSNNKAMNAKISRMNAQMQTYYKKFDAMEQLLQQMQSQQSTLDSYFSS